MKAIVSPDKLTEAFTPQNIASLVGGSAAVVDTTIELDDPVFLDDPEIFEDSTSEGVYLHEGTARSLFQRNESIRASWMAFARQESAGFYLSYLVCTSPPYKNGTDPDPEWLANQIKDNPFRWVQYPVSLPTRPRADMSAQIPVLPITPDRVYMRCVWCNGENWAPAVISYSRGEVPCYQCGLFLPEHYQLSEDEDEQ